MSSISFLYFPFWRFPLEPGQQQPTEAEIIRQIEKGLSPIVVNEVKQEYKEKNKNDSNVKYMNQNESLKKSSVVNPSQLQYHNNPQEDDEFLKRLFNIQKEYGS